MVRSERLTLLFKANRVLQAILAATLFIGFRVWHLGVVQKDPLENAATKPTRRCLVESAPRATIRDRFNAPLAVNKICYHAAIDYSAIRALPRRQRREHIRQLANFLAPHLQKASGEVEDLIHAEAAYYDHTHYRIQENISEELYYKLRMQESQWVGLIAERASLRYYPRGKVASHIIGTMGAITPTLYQKFIRRKKELAAFLQSLEREQEWPLPEGVSSIDQARWEYAELVEKGYRIQDLTGTSGIEKSYEELLRGFGSLHHYYTDAKGRHLWELGKSREPIPGKRVMLSLSAELQEYIEKLLTLNEEIRKPQSKKAHSKTSNPIPPKEPWMKGGAIVVLDPNNGDILAAASYPRFDPNDFVQKGKRTSVLECMESPHYLAEIWDGLHPLRKERYEPQEDFYFTEELDLTWEHYLRFILCEQGDVYRCLTKGPLSTLPQVHSFLTEIEELAKITDGVPLSHVINLLFQPPEEMSHTVPVSASQREMLERKLNLYPERVNKIRRALKDVYQEVPHTYDKVLLADLSTLALPLERFSQKLRESVGQMGLQDYRDDTQAFLRLQVWVKEQTRILFGEEIFSFWRQDHEKTFLREKRAKEQQANTYARPYTLYLSQKEQELFSSFWERWHIDILSGFLTGIWEKDLVHTKGGRALVQHFSAFKEELAAGAHTSASWRESYTRLSSSLSNLPQESIQDYLSTMQPVQERKQQLYGHYPFLRNSRSVQQSKDLALAFYPKYGYGYLRSYAYRQAATQGSLFKLVTGYSAMMQRFLEDPTANPNPLTFFDKPHRVQKEWFVGYTLGGTPIPRKYKGGVLPRTLKRDSGKTDMVRALEITSNSYFALLAADHLKQPMDLVYATKAFGFGSKTGSTLDGEIAGFVPEDVAHNQTALYALSIGQHKLVVTPLQSAVMLAAIANGGKVLRPKIVDLLAGSQPLRTVLPTEIDPEKTPFGRSFLRAGIGVQPFIKLLDRDLQTEIQRTKSFVRTTLPMPKSVRDLLMKGMRKACERQHAFNMPALTKLYEKDPSAIQALLELHKDVIGKTGTPEQVESLGVDRLNRVRTYNHTWMGALLLDEEERPELVVIVYLRYGTYGSGALPLVAQIAKRYREITHQMVGNNHTPF